MAQRSRYTPLVTCVIPVYNAEQYLSQTVESLMCQTYDNLEIVLVDDKSTDKSWDMCLEYARENQNIKVYRNLKNAGGPLRGRERGIKEATGEWITFMDCDDYVTPKYIENLVAATDNGRYDIAVTGHSRLYSDGRIEDFKWHSYSQTTEERLLDLYTHILQKNHYLDPVNTVGQNLVRASVAKKTDLSSYHNKIYAEDVIMALAFLSNSKNGVNFVDHHDYIWRQVEGSASHGGFYRTANREDFFNACFDIFYKNTIYKKISDKLPLISIIVPTYNTEKYLSKCIDSLLNQTYINTEIVLVDDKSSDNSPKISSLYAKSNRRIKLINKSENEGLNKARQDGFNASIGKYTMFVDSDDALDIKTLQKAYHHMIYDESEVVTFAMHTFSDDEKTPSNTTIKSRQTILLQTKEDIAGYAFFGDNNLSNVYHMTVWGKLYKRKIVEKIDWNISNYRSYEDIFWTPQALLCSSRIVIFSDELYFYRRNHVYGERNDKALSGKLIGNSYNGKTVGYLELIKHRADLYRKLSKKYRIGGLSERIDELEQSFLWARLHHLAEAKLMDSENNNEYIKQMIEEHIKHDNTQKELLGRLQQRNELLESELASFLGIKRSARLLVGNVKRRLTGAQK